MVLGSPFQTGGSGKDNFFINAAIPLLTTGKTLAECMIGHTYNGGGDSETIYGDPTFHYNKIIQPASYLMAILPSGPTIDGANFSGNVSIRVITWNIFSFELYIDENIVLSDSTIIHNYEKGNHTVLAVGYDENGNEKARKSIALNII